MKHLIMALAVLVVALAVASTGHTGL